MEMFIYVDIWSRSHCFVYDELANYCLDRDKFRFAGIIFIALLSGISLELGDIYVILN